MRNTILALTFILCGGFTVSFGQLCVSETTSIDQVKGVIVTEYNGEPLENALVVISKDQEAKLERHEARSDAEGKFMIAGVKPGLYYILISTNPNIRADYFSQIRVKRKKAVKEFGLRVEMAFFDSCSSGKAMQLE